MPTPNLTPPPPPATAPISVWSTEPISAGMVAGTDSGVDGGVAGTREVVSVGVTNDVVGVAVAV
ncbi:hypothetical protein [Nocardia brasiliensis]|uniref:hypothetical protein n=1 Tax=Nocardia brasiliensis TaxID=37326 RepID=UPI0024559820|nr:hypothetical protein [Nocardia brasiliensis]